MAFVLALSPVRAPRQPEVPAGAEVARGGHSWLERHVLRRLAEAGLPRPVTQQVLTRAGDTLVGVDLHVPGTTVVVELLGDRCHSWKAPAVDDAATLVATVRAALARPV